MAGGVSRLGGDALLHRNTQKSPPLEQNTEEGRPRLRFYILPDTTCVDAGCAVCGQNKKNKKNKNKNE